MTEAHLAPELPPVAEPMPRIHVVGIGGAGMSAIAIVLAGMGYRVSGTDRAASPTLDALIAEGIDARVGHRAEQVGDAVLVTASTAVPGDNPEIVAATQAGTPVWSRAAMLSALTRRQPTLAIAGTHGKTTTASMLACALDASDLGPSFIIGAEVRSLGCAARWIPDAPWFIVEADESDGTFVELTRAGAVVTSVEPDHLVHYGSFDGLVAAFDRFVAETAGPVAVCVDDDEALRLAERTKHTSLVTYGTADRAAVRIEDHHGARASSRQVLRWDGATYEVALRVPGLHNVRNATGAFAIAVAIGVDPTRVAEGLGQYTGVARRFEFRGEHADITFVDDYAHLPAEIEAALAAAGDGDWRRIVVVFQPHRYTRTADLHASFGQAFAAADTVVVTDIYSAGETLIDGVNGELIADSIRMAAPNVDVTYVESLERLPVHLVNSLEPGDLCLTLGAGDITSVPDLVLRLLRGDE